MKRIVVKLDRCIGCRSCEVACAREHSPAKGLGKREGREERLLPRIKVQFGPAEAGKKRGKPYPVRCRHCDDPKCVTACMAGALYKGEDGAVHHDRDRCVGCWMCIMACPYGAITRDVESHTIVKCDLCPDRVSPACVAACRKEAMIIQWEEVDVPNEPVVEVLEG